MKTRLLVISILAAALLSAVPALAYAAADDTPPGVPLPASPVAGTLMVPQTPPPDFVDYYFVDLLEGDELTLAVNRTSGSGAVALHLNYVSGEFSSEHIASDYTAPETFSYVVPAGKGGRYLVSVANPGAEGPQLAYSLAWTKRHAGVMRLFGGDRYESACAVSRSGFESATTVILASGVNYPDALAASGLAGVLHAPVLLIPGKTSPNYIYEGLPQMVFDEIGRLGATDIKIIGSGSAIATAIADSLAAGPEKGGGSFNVERIAGANRFDTARKIALRIRDLGGSSECFLASGRNYPDALAVAPVAYACAMPILLTEPTRLSAEASSAIASLDATHVISVGYTSSVATSVITSVSEVMLRMPATPDTHERWFGLNRYETAVAVAGHAADRVDWQNVAICTGRNFPDALAAGAFIGSRHGVLLLSDPKTLSYATRIALQDNGSVTDGAFLIGSESALSWTVFSSVANALELAHGR